MGTSTLDGTGVFRGSAVTAAIGRGPVYQEKIARFSLRKILPMRKRSPDHTFAYIAEYFHFEIFILEAVSSMDVT